MKRSRSGIGDREPGTIIEGVVFMTVEQATPRLAGSDGDGGGDVGGANGGGAGLSDWHHG